MHLTASIFKLTEVQDYRGLTKPRIGPLRLFSDCDGQTDWQLEWENDWRA